jgi:hypothetical protein
MDTVQPTEDWVAFESNRAAAFRATAASVWCIDAVFCRADLYGCKAPTIWLTLFRSYDARRALRMSRKSRYLTTHRTTERPCVIHDVAEWGSLHV